MPPPPLRYFLKGSQLEPFDSMAGLLESYSKNKDICACVLTKPCPRLCVDEALAAGKKRLCQKCDKCGEANDEFCPFCGTKYAP
jgi:hypothetical protein